MNVLFLGYGNPGRGDDGLGPALVEAVEQRFPEVTCLTAMQLRPEHVLDLAAHDLACIADAGMATSPPFTFARLRPRRDASITTHSLSPWELLAIYRDVLETCPPPTFLLTLAGERFDLGEELSYAARRHLEAALVFAAALLACPNPESWQKASI